ncbi:putative ATP-dependent DNA helicase HFM1, partial [Stegodyphus mimosarum]
MVKLILVDEIHLLNEEERGATMEAALSRMKTIHAILSLKYCNKQRTEPG